MTQAAARDAILAVVAAIPAGRVMTYGHIALQAGLPRRARLVGKILSGLPEGSPLPWWRVVNASGAISPRGWMGHDDLQRLLLEEEGVAFSAAGRINLKLFSVTPVV
ncbi:MGMT family protein [Leeia oryzae]|uniref:MGMT family protein n=1 Tax=Leeia oryzae TaxID=356662 RepID=UPI000360519E|nr:MGMT family protein [Leeia oryzae]